MLQPPPVTEGAVFETLTPDQVNKYVKSMSTFDIWSLFSYDELTINMRQKGDEVYRNILKNIRVGNITEAATCTLNTRLYLADKRNVRRFQFRNAE